MNKTNFFLILFIIFSLVGFQFSAYGEDYSLSITDKIITPPPITTFDLTEKDADYKETPLRRFETIFFISMPAAAIFSLLGVVSFRGASGVSGPFTSNEYLYIVLSTIGISFSIALNDNRITYRKEFRLSLNIYNEHLNTISYVK